MQTLEVSTRDEWQLELAKSYKDPRQLLPLGLIPTLQRSPRSKKIVFVSCAAALCRVDGGWKPTGSSAATSATRR